MFSVKDSKLFQFDTVIHIKNWIGFSLVAYQKLESITFKKVLKRVP